MIYDPEIHHLRSIRLKTYDYTCAGAYYVTICTQDWLTLFGEITDGTMHLNAAGQTIETIWHELPDHYSGVALDAFVIMPNHVHGIIILTRDAAEEAAHPFVRAAAPGFLAPQLEGGQARGLAPTEEAATASVRAAPRGCPSMFPVVALVPCPHDCPCSPIHPCKPRPARLRY